jgi:hypothetical protein
MNEFCARCGKPLRASRSNANRGEIVRCRSCYRRDWYVANRQTVKRDSKRYYRETCERRLEVAAEWRASHPEQHRQNARRFKLKSKYGITPEQYDAMYAEQRGLCFLCGRSQTGSRRLDIDHCHRTRQLRKLLCGICNRFVGVIERDPGWLARTLEYLTLFPKTGGGAFLPRAHLQDRQNHSTAGP